MENFELPKSFDEFVDARKAGFLKVKEYVENGGHLVGCSAPTRRWSFLMRQESRS